MMQAQRRVKNTLKAIMVLVLRNDADTFRAESCCRVSWGAITYVENVKLNLAFTMWGQFVQ